MTETDKNKFPLEFEAMDSSEFLNKNLSDESAARMAALFIGHGSPMNAIEDNIFARSWREIGESLPRPKAILSVSAHWETSGTYVTSMPNPPTIHDFGGFPRELYEIQYPAPGNPVFAAELSSSGHVKEMGQDNSWGLDHGTWSVLRRMYPNADIPVVQMSLDYTKPMAYHFGLARQLKSLRNKGVLIMGSGNLVHNLGRIDWSKRNDEEFGHDWALEANDIFKKHILDGNHKAIEEYSTLGKEVRLAVPTPDHLIPLLYVLALKEDNDTVSFFNDRAVMGSLTMTSVIIG